jgi:formate dehydrogenase assembly factor FdhD
MQSPLRCGQASPANGSATAIGAAAIAAAEQAGMPLVAFVRENRLTAYALAERIIP